VSQNEDQPAPQHCCLLHGAYFLRNIEEIAGVAGKSLTRCRTSWEYLYCISKGLKDSSDSFKMLLNLGTALALFSLATAAFADRQMSAIERKVRVS
jgi:hypothetical protein